MHKCFARLLALSLFPVVTALAQPAIGYPAISSASYRTPGMPGSGVAQGSIFTIFGTGLGPTTGTQAFTFPLPTSLGGTSLTVTVGSTQVSAIILFTVSTQVNAILPSTTPVGIGTFTVTYDRQTSAPEPIQVVASAFGIFTFNSSGSGQAIATDVNYNLNTIIHTFHPGDYGILWGTGLGAINGSDAGAPPVGNLPGPITVYVGNTSAAINYQGRSGCCAGLDQVVFQVPAGVTGCYVPIAVQAGGVLGNIGNIATIAVSDSGQTCTDSVMGQDLISQLAAGQTVNFGYIRLESWIAKYAPESEGNANEDFGMATFSQYTPGNAGLAEYGVSSGYCVAVDCSNGCDVNTITGSLSDSSAAQLDAGAALSVQYAPVVALPQEYNGFYAAYLSGDGRYLWSGLTYPVVGTGGSAVGPFSVTDVTSVPTATLTGITNSQTLSLSGDLTIEWTGGDPTMQNGQVTIFAESYNQLAANTYLAEFLQCTAPVAAQKFTIPGWVLSAMPPSSTLGSAGDTYPGGWIQVGQYNTPTTFTATGLTSGIITDIFYNGLGVYYQ
jgi:uncharacterized protein (TIGR03437 family)